MRRSFQTMPLGIRLLTGALCSAFVLWPTNTAQAQSGEDDVSVDEFFQLVETNLARFQSLRIEFLCRVRYEREPELNRETRGIWWYRADGYERVEKKKTRSQNIFTRPPNFQKGFTKLLDDRRGLKKFGIIEAGGKRKPWAADSGGPKQIFLLPIFVQMQFLYRPTFEAAGWETLAGRRCLKVSFLLIDHPEPNRRYRETYWLDLERGGNVIRFDKESGNRLRSQLSELRLHELEGDLWFPVYGRIDSDPPGGKLSLQEIEVDPTTIEVNSPLDDELFDLKFPDGTRVHDTITDRRYYQGGKPTVTRATPTAPPSQGDLDQLVEKAETQRRTIRASSLTRKRFRSWPYWMLGAVSALILAGGIVLSRRAGH